jgi:hypothetical protein
LNAVEPIDVTSGKSMDVSEEQLRNALLPIDVTFGKKMDVSA